LILCILDTSSLYLLYRSYSSRFTKIPSVALF